MLLDREESEPERVPAIRRNTAHRSAVLRAECLHNLMILSVKTKAYCESIRFYTHTRSAETPLFLALAQETV